MRLGHAVGMKRLQRVQVLARADELDRNARDVLDRQQRTATSVAVQLGHDHAVQLQGVVERLGTVDRVLARHAVHDQIDLVGLHAVVDPRQLLHQLLVDRQPAGRVQDHDPDLLLLGLLAPPAWHTLTGSLADLSE